MDRIEEVSLAIDFIEANLTERLNLDRIADAVHYSKYHLHRVFSDTVGLTVHEYMKRRQLTESAKLLVFSEKPIVDIALLSGYRSQQAFTHPRRIFTEKLTSGYCSICLSNVSTLSGWGSMPDPHCRFANIGSIHCRSTDPRGERSR